MKLPRTERFAWTAGVLAVAIILVVLAVLQYHWSDELNQAASDRLRAGLQASMMGFREELNRELASVALAIRPNSPGTEEVDSDAIASRFASWKRSSAHPDLVRSVYLFSANHQQKQLFKLDQQNVAFEQASWPPELQQLAAPLTVISTTLTSLHNAEGPASHEPSRPGSTAMPLEPPPFIYQVGPTVLLPHLHSSPNAAPGKLLQADWIIVELNPDVIRDRIFPELAHRYFSGSDGLEYDLAVLVRDQDDTDVFYSSGTQGWAEGAVTPDGQVNLFGPPLRFAGQERPAEPARGQGEPSAPRAGEPHAQFRAYAGPFHVEPFPAASGRIHWELIAKHRRGSLEAALRSLRRRHLAISFGVLLVLAATIAMTLLATRRAQRLAALQMQFVAGVSHELRTPLAVIASAADNIADNIIEDRSRIVKYGKVIRTQARELSQLVEQILLFAATRNGGYNLTLAPVHPTEIVRAALAASAELIRTSGVTVVQDVPEHLPSVSVDLTAISHCLQNLIVNGVKYGGASRWLGISAYAIAQTDGNSEIQIAVEDHGIGMTSREIRQAFDPFYRSPAVISAQIHGSGLGLALAKTIAESMGGNITVTSELGKGSRFVLHLPAASTAEQTSVGQQNLSEESGVPTRES